MDKLSYALGIGIGRQLSQMGADSLNIDDFAQAIKDIIGGQPLQVSDSEAQQLVNSFFQQQEAKQRAAAAEKGKAAKLARNSLLRTRRKTASSPCPAACSIRC